MSGDIRMETDEREKLVGVIGLHILHYHLFHVVDKKTFKILWELHKKVRNNFLLYSKCCISVIGYISNLYFFCTIKHVIN